MSKEQISQEAIDNAARLYSLRFNYNEVSGNDIEETFKAGVKMAPSTDKWVDVKEGLPDYDHPVLWLCENGNIHVEALDKDGNPWLFPEEDSDNEWNITGSKATHWMKLPEPPPNKK